MYDRNEITRIIPDDWRLARNMILQQARNIDFELKKIRTWLLNLSHTTLADIGSNTHSQIDNELINLATNIDTYNLTNGGIITNSNAFSKVWVYNGAYTDKTIPSGKSIWHDIQPGFTYYYFYILQATSDFLYLGLGSKFQEIFVPEISIVAVNLTLKAEYWNGSNWTNLSFTDHTINFTNTEEDFWDATKNNVISFTSPGDWTQNAVNGSDLLYYVRLSTTTLPTTAPRICTILPAHNYALKIFGNKNDSGDSYKLNGKGFPIFFDMIEFQPRNFGMFKVNPYYSQQFTFQSSGKGTGFRLSSNETNNGSVYKRLEVLRTALTINGDRRDYDFILRKLTSGDAAYYDAGLDTWALSGALTLATTLKLAAGATVSELSTDGTLADNSDVAVPTEKAVKTYVDSAKRIIHIPATMMTPTVTAGCSALTLTETTAGRPDIYGLYYDDTIIEHAQFSAQLPANWDKGTITVSIYWTTVHGNAGDVVWTARSVCVSNGDTIDTDFGTAVDVTDTSIAAEDMHAITTGNMTVGGTPASGDIFFLDISRKASSSADTMPGDAVLVGITLHFQCYARDEY